VVTVTPLTAPSWPPGEAVTASGRHGRGWLGQSRGVTAVLYVLYYVLFFFWLLLTARIVADLVRAFARDWRPAGGVAASLETVYTVTDPPVKALRRVIPMVRIGSVGLDLSIMVLLLVVFILMRVVDPG
jgi:YggT family protein